MKKNSWVMAVICLAIFVTLRLVGGRHKEEREEIQKPIVPQPVHVEQEGEAFLSHPWLQEQPEVEKVNVEVVRDLRAFEQFCTQVCNQKLDFTYEQVEDAVIETLKKLQQEIPFSLPEDLYNVICIADTPPDWLEAPVPFHVYKRLYIDDTKLGLPFYLDVRVFELDGYPLEELIAWHLATLDGEPMLLHQAENRSLYRVEGQRTRDTAHGFATDRRALFVDFVEQEERLYVLYAEAPLETFTAHENLFNQLVQEAKNEKMDLNHDAHLAPVIR